MASWTDPAVRERVVALAYESRSAAEHLDRVRGALGDPTITSAALERAWARWQSNHGTPGRFGCFVTAARHLSRAAERLTVEQLAAKYTGPWPEPKRRLEPEVEDVGPDPLPAEAPNHVTRHEPKDGWTVIVSDQHYPIHDRVAEAGVLALCRDLRPHTVVVNGDALDAWDLSTFDREAWRRQDGAARLVDELEAFRPFGLEVSRIVGASGRVFIGEGNHEQRLERHINATPALHGLPGLRWSALYDLPGNVRFLAHGYRLVLGQLHVVHGDQLPGGTGPAPAARALGRFGNRSVVFGHTHRYNVATRTTHDEDPPRELVAINSGHLSAAHKQTWAGPEPDWQTAFVVVRHYAVAGVRRFQAFPIQIVGGYFYFDGRLYGGRLAQ